MKWVYRAARGAMLALGLVAWLLAVAFMVVTALMAVVGKKIPHDPTYGNCWIFALPKFAEFGGYLGIRWADKVRLFRRWRIPHVAWIPVLPKDIVLEQFEPISRSGAQWLPWQTILYHGRVKRTESAHPAKAEPG